MGDETGEHRPKRARFDPQSIKVVVDGPPITPAEIEEVMNLLAGWIAKALQKPSLDEKGKENTPQKEESL